ncbi:MAG: single-stranded-DNA-specific exonuclease RecJ [Prochloraceae cyanobacterium]|nr:single-stranded-DNA-specific exonuclease RecJ [Prochloraceae cyanobacterium]
MNYNLPQQRWEIAAPIQEVDKIVEATGLLPIVAKVLLNRGINTPELALVYQDPGSVELPSPLEEFTDLERSVELIKKAIATETKIAICGDYDADGMTSTALLLRALKHLGGDIYYEIPSRMKDGYGINNRIVEKCGENNVGLIITVDNGISAKEPITLAVDLGIDVIITDHHDLPEELPPASAILNPKRLSKSSPYYGLAGVGVAYILAVTAARDLGQLIGLTSQLLELFTLGTIADLAPLVGVNRRWLKRGLKLLANSQLLGVQKLIEVSGITEGKKNLKPDDIGFKLGPRINAIGRIGDPQTAIELLTTEEEKIAESRAIECEKTNRKRQELCAQIEYEAIEIIEKTPIAWQQDRVLVVFKADWHHGVIGIVASRLVDRYGVPVFIATCEENEQNLRGSARGIPEFNIFDALEYCRELLAKFGGHKAAGGFSLSADNLNDFQTKLSEFAHQCLEPKHLKPLIKIDDRLDFDRLNENLYSQIDSLQPWGIGNDFPVFWTQNVEVLNQALVGQEKKHLKLVLVQADRPDIVMKAIAWSWGNYYPLPKRIDIAYKLQENNWNGNSNIELEIVGIRPFSPDRATRKAYFKYKNRAYDCNLWDSLNELRIRNDEGKILAITKGQKVGLLRHNRENTAKQVDVTKSPYYDLIKAALAALESKR